METKCLFFLFLWLWLLLPFSIEFAQKWWMEVERLNLKVLPRPTCRRWALHYWEYTVFPSYTWKLLPDCQMLWMRRFLGDSLARGCSLVSGRITFSTYLFHLTKVGRGATQMAPYILCHLIILGIFIYILHIITEKCMLIMRRPI